MYLKEIQLFMARSYGPGSYDPSYEKRGQDYPLPYVRWTENRNMEGFPRLVEQQDVRLDPLITDRFKLDQAPAAYQKILEPDTSTLAVVLEYDRVEPEEFQSKRNVPAFARPGPQRGI
jgi:hypothetical protein